MTFIFPQTEPNGTVTVENGIVKPHFSTTGGMTLRDWFAGQALAAIIAKHPPMGRVGSLDGGDTKMTTKDADRIQREIATGAYEYADAMLKARDQ